MTCNAQKAGVPAADPAPAPARTGEGAKTALEAMLRKRKQVESPEPPDGKPSQPAKP